MAKSGNTSGGKSGTSGGKGSGSGTSSGGQRSSMTKVIGKLQGIHRIKLADVFPRPTAIDNKVNIFSHR